MGVWTGDPGIFPCQNEALYAITWGPSGCNAQYPEFWISMDHGASWTNLGVVDSITGGDSYSSLVSDGENIYVVLWATGNYPSVYRTTDGGGTWELRGEITPAGTGAGEPSVAMQLDQDHLYVATWDYNKTPKFYTSTDWGTTWSYTSDICDLLGGEAGLEDVLDITNDNSGNLYALVWKEYNTSYYYPRIYSSSDFGNTWTLRSSLSEGDNFDDPAGSILYWPGNGGRLYIMIWSDDLGTSAHFYESTDMGDSWTFKSNITVAYPASDMNNFLSLADFSDGTLFCAFWNDQSSNPIEVYTSTDLGTTWSLSGTIPRNTAGNDLYRPTVDIMPLYNPILVKEMPRADRGQSMTALPGRIRFVPETGGHLILRVYDASGRRVAQVFNGTVSKGQLVESQVPENGVYAVAWLNGRLMSVKLLSESR